MGATEQQMDMLSRHHVTHVSYILILYSISFLLYLFVNILLHIYAVHTWPEEDTDRRTSRAASTMGRHSSASGLNGSAHANGRLSVPKHKPTDSQQVRDAEEFELEGLISDADEVQSPKDVESSQSRVALH
jgi:hypothetical protein